MSTTASSSFGDRLASFIADDVARTDHSIDAETDLLLTGLVSSLGVILIVDWMEADLDIVIDPADVVLENFQTVGQMVAYANRRQTVARS